MDIIFFMSTGFFPTSTPALVVVLVSVLDSGMPWCSLSLSPSPPSSAYDSSLSLWPLLPTLGGVPSLSRGLVASRSCDAVPWREESASFQATVFTSV